MTRRAARAGIGTFGPPLLAAVALVAAMWTVQPYTLGVVARTCALGLLAASVAVLVGTTGLPTLGQVAPFAVGAYATALLAQAGVTVGPVQVLVAAGTAAVFSAVVGLAAVQTRGIQFLMVTLAIGVLAGTAAEHWKSVTGGTDGLAGIPPTRPLWGAPPLIADRQVYGYALAVSAATLVTAWLVLRRGPGLLLRGARDQEARMRASGHPVTAYLWFAYVGAGAMAGIGGALLVTSQRYVSPNDFGFEVSALVLLAVTIGGSTSMVSAAVVTAFVVWLRDWFGAMLPGQTPLLLGVLFVLAVYVLPDGFAGVAGRWAARGWSRSFRHAARSVR
jgi:branched-chain amino acid transport system permease protein